MEFTCSNSKCRERLEIADEYAGQTAQCPFCQATTTVPALPPGFAKSLSGDIAKLREYLLENGTLAVLPSGELAVILREYFVEGMSEQVLKFIGPELTVVQAKDGKSVLCLRESDQSRAVPSQQETIKADLQLTKDGRVRLQVPIGIEREGREEVIDKLPLNNCAKKVVRKLFFKGALLRRLFCRDWVERIFLVLKVEAGGDNTGSVVEIVGVSVQFKKGEIKYYSRELAKAIKLRQGVGS